MFSVWRRAQLKGDCFDSLWEGVCVCVKEWLCVWVRMNLRMLWIHIICIRCFMICNKQGALKKTTTPSLVSLGGVWWLECIFSHPVNVLLPVGALLRGGRPPSHCVSPGSNQSICLKEMHLESLFPSSSVPIFSPSGNTNIFLNWINPQDSWRWGVSLPRVNHNNLRILF